MEQIRITETEGVLLFLLKHDPGWRAIVINRGIASSWNAADPGGGGMLSAAIPNPWVLFRKNKAETPVLREKATATKE